MAGTCSISGRKLDGIQHLRNSVRDILTTPIGTRVMRRDYGSRLYELVDAPYSPAVKLDLIAATAEALMRWEPRIEVESVLLRTFETGRVVLDLTGRYLPDGRDVGIEGIVVQ